MNHAVLHSGVQRGPRLVYSEERLLCRPIFYLLFYMIWHNYVNNGSFCFFVVVFCFFYWFFCFIYLFILLLQEPGFPVCCVAVLYLNCSWFVCLFVLIFLLFPFFFFTWQQSLITGRQKNTWPWWWGIAQCLGGPRKRRCVKRSTLPGWPVWYLHQISPAVLPAPGFRQLLTDGGPSVLPARRSWRWTRSLSCSAAKSAAPWCCPS